MESLDEFLTLGSIRYVSRAAELPTRVLRVAPGVSMTATAPAEKLKELIRDQELPRGTYAVRCVVVVSFFLIYFFSDHDLNSLCSRGKLALRRSAPDDGGERRGSGGGPAAPLPPSASPAATCHYS
ncbi:hypothetical protein MTO96_009848 [Rhipicephalus appendiculatus]